MKIIFKTGWIFGVVIFFSCQNQPATNNLPEKNHEKQIETTGQKDNSSDKPEIKHQIQSSQDSSNKTEKSGRETKKSENLNQAVSFKTIKPEKFNLEISIPADFKQNGKFIEAYGRNNELLNREIRFTNDRQNELVIKFYPSSHAGKIFDFYQNQFQKKQGNFSIQAEKKKINDLTILYGISERKFDGKGHPLQPPHVVYFVVWKDNKGLYEIYYRLTNTKNQAQNSFEKIIESIKPL